MEIEFDEEIIQHYERGEGREKLSECIPGGIAEVDVKIREGLFKKLYRELFSLSINPSRRAEGILSPLRYIFISSSHPVPEDEEFSGYLVGRMERSGNSLTVELTDFYVCLFLIENQAFRWFGDIPVLSSPPSPMHIYFYGVYDVKNEIILKAKRLANLVTIQPPPDHPVELKDIKLTPSIKFSGNIFSNVKGILGTFHSHPIVPEPISRGNVFPSALDVPSSFFYDLPFPKLFMGFMFPAGYAALTQARLEGPHNIDKEVENLYQSLFEFKYLQSPIITYLHEDPDFGFFEFRSEDYQKWWKELIRPFDHDKIMEAFMGSRFITKENIEEWSRELNMSKEELINGGYLRLLWELRLGRIAESFPIYQKMKELGIDERYFLPQICRRIIFY